MLYGNVPFKGADMKDLHKQIIEANYELKDEISAGKNRPLIHIRGERPNQRAPWEEPQKAPHCGPGPETPLACQGRDPK